MFDGLKQLIPQEACLRCDVCCRYPDRMTAYAPCFLPEEAEALDEADKKFSGAGERPDLKTPPVPYKDCFICPHFAPDANSCRIYSRRPLDCRLYPFMVTYGGDYRSVWLTLDEKCPYLKGKADSRAVKAHADYLASILEDDAVMEKLNLSKSFINGFQADSVPLKRLESLGRKACLADEGLTRISLKDKPVFDDYLARSGSPLSAFNFSAIYVWSDVLNILWKEIDGALCVFAGNDRDYFLLLPPLCAEFNAGAVKESFAVLSRVNGRSGAARIENIPQGLADRMSSAGLKVKENSKEFVYERLDIAKLKGGRFKSKRALAGRFEKGHDFEYGGLGPEAAFECLELYRRWAAARLSEERGDYYRMLIEDGYFAQKAAFLNFDALGLKGCFVKTGGAIRAYSIGYPLNKDTFVILFETADLGVKGLAQFIFREFCRGLAGYRYINTMDDSGLENLRRVKESYHPSGRLSVFTAMA